LGGPAGVTPHQAVAIFEKISGKPFAVNHVPVEALQGQLAGADDPMQKSFVGLMLSLASTTAIDMSATLKAFPLKLKTVEDYARSVML
jgi:hypothetical protein